MYAEKLDHYYSISPSPPPHPPKARPGCCSSTPGPTCRGHPAPLRVPVPFPSPSTLDHVPAKGSPRPRQCCAVFPCLRSPSSHPRAALGMRRNPIHPTSRESDPQGQGPQASGQALPINIKQRGCPRVLPRHVLSLGQVFTSAQCQAVVPHCRVLPVRISSLCCHIHCTGFREQQEG